MNQIHFFNLTSTFFPVLYLVFFTFFFQARKVTAVDENFRICTVPRYCGKMNIKFPFFIQGRDDPRCGYPGFEIHCRNNSLPSISFGDGDYIINDIYYHNQSCHLSRAVSFDKYAICSHSIRNISLLSDWFFLPSLQNKTFLFSNCNLSSSHELSRYNIHCAAKNESNATLALFSNDPMLNFASEYCDTRVVVPVAFTSGEGSLEGMLNRGFMVEWITSNCSICEASGGKCGFDNATRHFKCFCRDRPHAWHCTPKNKNELRFKLGLGLGYNIHCAAKNESNATLALFSNDPMLNFASEYCDTRVVVPVAFTSGEGSLEGILNKGFMVEWIASNCSICEASGGKCGFDYTTYHFKCFCRDRPHAWYCTPKNESRFNLGLGLAASSIVGMLLVILAFYYCIRKFTSDNIDENIEAFLKDHECLAPRRALIYEFMPNGSLEKFIFQERKDRRLNTRILHFDIKPHNILLDDEFIPKISDFGLAKLCLEKESAISMTGARGTAGYIAPEVFSKNSGRVSHKSDVYSYGMMVLEMVRGRKNISVEVDRTSEIYFPYWIYNHIELDEELGLEDIESEDDQERARKMIIVSLWCIQIDPSNRPTMSRVVEMLEGFTNSLTIPPKPFVSSPPRS
ncbi:hypothetical protein GOBAR_AA12429 [Gossypium barbadense]|uniref:non-specific serine/threonine protein kinase n=1 Tax=Gossypium barbadense TaxID=3634 RepID=A0A2P5XY10_GOSBA|nr:hypothetical protein GOBAR_AA12429 [Gossypium barbadense]